MIARIQSLPRAGRILVFIGFIVVIVTVMASLTLAVIVGSARSLPRYEPVSLLTDQITTREYVTLPDDDAYPAAIALSSDGTLYTGSYLHGAIWSIAPDLTVTEVPNTREQIGSVTGLTIAADGSLLVLDRIDALEAQGAIIWRVQADGQVDEVISLVNNERYGISIPDDIAVDQAGLIYISDRGPDLVWRFNADGSDGEIWWRTPDDAIGNLGASTSGLAYDPANDALVIADGVLNQLYRVSVNAVDPQLETVVLYDDNSLDEVPGFDGVDVAPDGMIYTAALGLNRVARIDPNTGALTYLAGAYRGSSDVVASADHVYVTNWDQRSLLPVTVLFFEFEIDPRLPFSIDQISFEADTATREE